MKKFSCYFGKSNILIDIFVRPATKEDKKSVENWKKFDLKNPIKAHYTEKACFFPWDIALDNLGHHGEIFAVISTIKGRERLEGLLHVVLNSNKEVEIEALEAAPWNREIYLGNNRQFRQIGLVLIGYAIIYGFLNKFNGPVSLNSLEFREQYYKDGIKMLDEGHGNFSFSLLNSYYFLWQLEKLGFVDLKGGNTNESKKK